MATPVRTLLVAVDSSSRAASAIRAASQIASPGSRVIVVRVLPDEPRTTPNPFQDVVWRWPGIPEKRRGPAGLTEAQAEAMEYARSAARVELEGLTRDLVTTGAWIHYEIVVGDPAQEILALAERESADLIVTASGGHSGLGQALLGSVTSTLIRAQRIPILVAPASITARVAAPEPQP